MLQFRVDLSSFQGDFPQACWRKSREVNAKMQATPLQSSASCRALKGCCLFRTTNATCRPRLALSRGRPISGDTWRSSVMPPTWAKVAVHAGFAYLSFRLSRCSSLSVRIPRIWPTTLRPFFSAISRTAFRDSG